MNVLLVEATWPQMRDLLELNPVVIVPTGSTEQHGPHLPLLVDHALAAEVARLAAERATEEGTRCLVTPPVWAGYSPHHMDFPGTVSLRAETFTALLTDIATSLHHHGFRRILFLNGHGGNTNLVRAAVQSLRFEHAVSTAAANYWDLAADAIAAWRESPAGGINHACEFETSMMLAVRPELVELDAVKDHLIEASAYASPDLTQGGAVTTAEPFSAFTDTGVLGAPSFATHERGKEILPVVVSAVAEYLHEFRRRGYGRAAAP